MANGTSKRKRAAKPKANGNGSRPESQQSIYARNRKFVQDYFLLGKRAIPTSIPKDAGLRRFLFMVEMGEPTLVKEMLHICCGRSQTIDLNVAGDQDQPLNVTYRASYADGLPGAAAAVALSEAAAGGSGS